MRFEDMFPPEEITDQEVRDFLAGQGLDLETQPAPCVLIVSDHYQIPVAEAGILVSHLRET